ncbi:AAA family ATPase [Methanoregula sp. UBA64]|jgi:wobble nucleotide-excising tRNase|uniref:AAA family ATPase n=1 Tax=Methanoregula sp. UBA64 TaxID=1915554 RepID=UPI0025FB2215|nr:AAA family ATPase [Methanoregula sp. UBA64]
MITRIKHITNYRIFQDFRWGSDLDDFKKYNLIYGWNGSGKTTLSKFFRQIELRETYPDCEDFAIITENGPITDENIAKSTLSIKVFNQDFIKENIFTESGEITPIFYLGQEDIAVKKNIDDLKKQLAAISDNIEKTRTNAEKQEKVFEQFSSERAKEIKTFLRSSGEHKYNTYNKNDFKNRCNILQKSGCAEKKLSPVEIEELRSTLSSKPKEEIVPILFDFPEIQELEAKVQKTLTTTVTAKVIERLNLDSNLNNWVNQGRSILKEKNLDLCPFCNQKLPPDFLTHLEDHFNKEYELAIRQIDSQILELESIKQKINLALPSKSDFYDEISRDYEKQKQLLLLEISKYSSFVDLLIVDLNNKRKNPYVKIISRYEIPQLKLNELANDINLLISGHNTKTQNFTNAIRIARVKFEDHFVAINLVKYAGFESALDKITRENSDLELKYGDISQQIISLEKKIVEHRTPAEEINAELKSYLGHEDLKFDLNGEGYCILRNGTLAEALSEGEKTAISFVYFLKTLHDKDFDFSHSVIVVDDPISSLDSNSLYNAFSFLKNRTENAQQLFVFTHNYSFFKEVKNWLITNKSRSEKSSMYMIKNYYVDSSRKAKLEPLDNLLKKYTSEYHYLFSLVYAQAHSSTHNLKEFYLLPNISRRLLESFFAFRYPSQIGNLGNQFTKSKISDEQKTRILRYADSNSHSDHIHMDNEGDLSYLEETPQVMQDILDLIKKDDETHFKEMVSLMSNNTASNL